MLLFGLSLPQHDVGKQSRQEKQQRQHQLTGPALFNRYPTNQNAEGQEEDFTSQVVPFQSFGYFQCQRVKEAFAARENQRKEREAQLYQGIRSLSSGKPKHGPETPPNYLIQVTLAGTANPPIIRLLSLPPHLKFDNVDQVLQIAFGWTDSHMHRFDITLVDDDASNLMGPIPRLSLLPNPDSWPDDLKEKYEAESKVTLADVYEAPDWKDKADICYEYDHGDGWIHHFALLGRATPGTNAQFGVRSSIDIVCLGGQGHAAAEDVGGSWGWRNLKEAFKQPRKKDNKELISWYKDGCLNGDENGLDPYAWDILDVSDDLGDFGREQGAEGSVGSVEHDGGCCREHEHVTTTD